ncbi:MAG: bifunctional glutamate N-acetyltransferase/amino-acid acetyltransferase ArgJ [Myxococcales bacterium]|nr:bifunctional glutamate N-acetyltransferase/amino-acid acetyltransferase ArgJ [Myxococcales bacterium]
MAGFRLAGVACGIKASGRPDLAAIVAERPVPTAAVFTRNLVRAAPVEVAAERVRRGRAQAILVNSGNANACTGAQGVRDAERTTGALARALGCEARHVLPASTGVIGQPLDVTAIVSGLPRLVDALDEGGAAAFADAILTTDRGPKLACARFRVGRRDATVLAIAKGAGMIHPNMATTLGFVLTDAPVGAPVLRKALRSATEQTFNRVSVDGDTSTNDTVVAMASGALGGASISADSASARRLEGALTEALSAVALMIVADGEGAEHLVRIEVARAPNDPGALRVARAIATSLLVKTALHGCDPNWGRIVAAAGRAGVRFDPSKVRVRIGDVTVFARGLPVRDDAVEREAAAVMKRAEYTVRVDLGAGTAAAHYTTCDIGHEYVRINADYRS